MNFFIPLLFFTSFIYSNNNENIDGVAAIIEEHIVLKSDLNQMLNMSIIQNKIDPLKDVEKVKTLELYILESMIDQKIILKKAEIVSVFVEEDEVDLALDQQIQMLVSQAGGEKKAEEALGQTLKNFRREFWYEMRDRLLSEKYQQQ